MPPKASPGALEVFLRTVVTPANHCPLDQKYALRQKLKEGNQAVVYRCVDKATGHVLAVKIYALRNMSPEELQFLQRELVLHRQVHHPNVGKYVDVLHWDGALYFVQELLDGKDLFVRQQEAQRFPERIAVLAVRGVLRAVQAIHSKDIVHRDIKLANVLLPLHITPEPTDANWDSAKLIDFGMAATCLSPSLFDDCGSVHFMAPEIGYASKTGVPYGKPVDLWAVGVLAFTLLSGRFPFYGNTPQQVAAKAELGLFQHMTDERWEVVSVEAKDFIRRLLVLDPNARPTAEGALQHPWMQSVGDFSASTQTTTRIVYEPDHNRATTVTKTTTSTTERVKTRTTRRSLGGPAEVIASASGPTHRRVSHDVAVRSRSCSKQ